MTDQKEELIKNLEMAQKDLEKYESILDDYRPAIASTRSKIFGLQKKLLFHNKKITLRVEYGGELKYVSCHTYSQWTENDGTIRLECFNYNKNGESVLHATFAQVKCIEIKEEDEEDEED